MIRLRNPDGIITRIDVAQRRDRGKTSIDLVFANGIHEVSVRLTPVLADELVQMINSELGRMSHV